MENKFIKGVIFGGLLVSAAAVGFAMSKGAWECTKKLKENIKPIIKNSLESFARPLGMAKDDFDELATALVKEYSKKKKFSNYSKKTIVSALKSKWDEMMR